MRHARTSLLGGLAVAFACSACDDGRARLNLRVVSVSETEICLESTAADFDDYSGCFPLSESGVDRSLLATQCIEARVDWPGGEKPLKPISFKRLLKPGECE